jgi:hypothetical protein
VFHQYWRGLSAVLISLFGWLLALRGLVLLAAPELFARAAVAASTGSVLRAVQFIFGFVALIGLWLTYTGWIAKPPAQS